MIQVFPKVLSLLSIGQYLPTQKIGKNYFQFFTFGVTANIDKQTHKGTKTKTQLSSVGKCVFSVGYWVNRKWSIGDLDL